MSIRIGVIGVGVMGEHHVRNYSAMESSELVGVFDKDTKKAKRIAKTFGITTYTNLPKLLSKIEAASICVPTQLHRQVALETISQGVHVLIEKPISLTLQDADKIIKAAKKHGVRLMIGHVERFNPAILTLKDVIHEDKIIYIESQRLGPYVEAHQDVGVTFDLMIHDIDIIRSLVKSPVKKISSVMHKLKSQTEDISHAQLLFENGAIAVLTASRITEKRERKLNVTLKDSYITADYQTQEVFIRSGLTSKYVGGQNVSYKQVGAIEIPYVQRGEPLRNELEHFVYALENNQPFSVTGEDGRDNLTLTLDIVKNSV